VTTPRGKLTPERRNTSRSAIGIVRKWKYGLIVNLTKCGIYVKLWLRLICRMARPCVTAGYRAFLELGWG